MCKILKIYFFLFTVHFANDFILFTGHTPVLISPAHEQRSVIKEILSGKNLCLHYGDIEFQMIVLAII